MNQITDNDDKVVSMEQIATQLEKTTFVDSCSSEKWSIRKQVWSLMQRKKYIKPYPTTCVNRIPNFKLSGIAAEKLSRLNEFRSAKCIKVNPSLAQMHIRFLTLKHGKQLLVPSPALTEDFMYLINPGTLKHSWQMKRASSKAGSKELGTVFTLSDQVHIDVYVVASVACSCKGVRLGKGMGYAELEWAILYTMGCVTDRTVVVTTIHDSQLVSENELPTSILSIHDLPVDVIITPSRVINVRQKLTKPSNGIIWDLVTEEQLKDIPILQQLHRKQFNKLPL